MALMPSARDDGAIFMLERDQLPEPGVRWTKITVFDMAGHHASAPIAPHLSRHLEN
jgi:hypothetical protein